LIVQSYKTDLFKAGQNLFEFVHKNLKSAKPKEKQIWVITSKIVSLSEKRLLSKESEDKNQLALEEYDQIFKKGGSIPMGLKFGLPLPWAGVDESNSESNEWILPPEDPFSTAKKLHEFICGKFSLKHLGIIISDSLVIPFRRGVTSAALGYHGFRGYVSSSGQKDLFGRKLEITQVNHADSLATAAQLLMGEGSEQRPLARIDKAPVIFSDDDQKGMLDISVEEDLFGSFFS
jgi:F420-0:gamma-glutamyl ligase